MLPAIYRKMRYISIIILFTFLTECYGQGKEHKYSVGLNLPSLIGRTVDLKIENNWKPHLTLYVCKFKNCNKNLNNKLA